MPSSTKMRWTPEADQLLLLKILETHNLSVNSKKVAEAWPVAEGQDGPTPRAISERLVKIRNMAGTSFSISKGNKSTTTPNTTPRKPRTKSVPSTPSSTKRKREDTVKAEPIPTDSFIKSETEGASGSSSPLKMEVDDTTPIDLDTILETPTKKTPLAHAMGGAANQLSPGYTLYMPPRGAAVLQVSPSKRVRKPAAPAPGMINWTSYDGDEQEVEIESSASEYYPENEMVQMPRSRGVSYV
ncbi:uncharacterized protein BO97DRAFT_405787 [Aspergillus homomorphus CBS 101889]|uniref:Uncharacterized protein n=1 Tax=Aspergillus homomorphus (strain CBS 101889) TaxID=1450537 RepID=A0A395HYX6_ASPHC|nr:hypothetical protein BO97DRAFT_405787 [Aspergillus homomorphus CBS 101889]RAL12068.1 hypothetical protein BO97DRAFT_405787 [Aspergillus homomorphus CBS 101889]